MIFVAKFVLYSNQGYCVAWCSGLHVCLVMWRSWVQTLGKAPGVSLSKKRYPCCLVLVGSRNGFERDFTIQLE